jgi:hypothetical protein
MQIDADEEVRAYRRQKESKLEGEDKDEEL